ncbi:MAG TPA: FixH family protein [Flavisolibacter sp.]|nr:FixH family protein [Flavisolibacter sp.]
MNWGKGIIITAAAFMAFILTLTIFMMNQTPELEERNYYEKDLKYQQVMDARQNVTALNQPVQFEYAKASQQIRLQLPVSSPALSGTLTFTRPSDAKQDYIVDLQLDTQYQQRISVTDLATGLWHVRIDWQANGKAYQSQTWEIIR